jgi:hypothetical protein
MIDTIQQISTRGNFLHVLSWRDCIDSSSHAVINDIIAFDFALWCVVVIIAIDIDLYQ